MIAERKITRGTVFRSGKLYEFRSRTILVVRAMPATAWRYCTKSGIWCHVRPPELSIHRMQEWLSHFDMLSRRDPAVHPSVGWRARQKAAAYRAFLDSIPSDLLHAVTPFPDRNFHLLALGTRSREAMELIQDHPLLGYALSCHWIFHDPSVSKPMRAARSLARKKRRVILDWLGFPASDSMMRLLRRLPASDCTAWRVLRLRQLVRDPNLVKLLSHCHTLTAREVDLLSTPGRAEYLTVTFVMELASLSPREALHRVRKLEDVERIALRLQRLVPSETYRSLAGLDRAHDQLANEFIDSRMRFFAAGSPFPPPPIPGTEAIAPILSEADLYAEGLELHHCVGSRGDRVRAGGREYYYQLLEPERGTICIRRETVGTGWRLDEARGARNRPLTAESLAVIHSWLENSKGLSRESSPLRYIEPESR